MTCGLRRGGPVVVWAGCFTCQPDGSLMWEGANAQALAGAHHKRYGHTTWADVTLHWRYGPRLPEETGPSDVPKGGSKDAGSGR